MKSLEHKIPPPLVAVIAASLMWGLSRVQAPVPLVPWLHNALRLIFGLAALAFASAGILSFRRARTTINPVRINQASKLVDGGIYRVTRNPMYVGLAFLLLAWAAHLAVPVTLLGPLVFGIFIHHFQILPEERALEEKFGNDYLAYKRKVRRWV